MLQLEVIGNLGADAELKEFSGGKKYVSFSVASSERRKNADGVTVENTTWVSVLWYGDGGQLLQYLKKGVKVFLRGKLIPKAYTDKSGNPCPAVNMYANEINLCGGGNNERGAEPAKDVEQKAEAPAAANDDLPF